MRFYFSRKPGCFVNENTGEEIIGSFTGTVREWYETLAYCIERNAEQVFKNNQPFKVVVSPDVMTILECSVLFRPRFDENLKYCNSGTYNNVYEAVMDRNQQRNLISASQNDKSFELEIKHMDII